MGYSLSSGQGGIATKSKKLSDHIAATLRKQDRAEASRLTLSEVLPPAMLYPLKFPQLF